MLTSRFTKRYVPGKSFVTPKFLKRKGNYLRKVIIGDTETSDCIVLAFVKLGLSQ
jgi:hypothetical protein